MASHTYSPEAHSRAVTKFVKTHLDRIEMRCTKDSGLKEKKSLNTPKKQAKV